MVKHNIFSRLGFAQSRTGMNVLIGVLFVLIGGCQMSYGQNVDYTKLEECFSDVDSAVRKQLDVINPLICRYRAPSRKRYVLPSHQQVVNSPDSSTVRSGLYTNNCRRVQATTLTQDEVKKLVDAKSEFVDQAAKLDQAVQCALGAFTTNGASLSGKLRNTYGSLFRDLDTLLSEVADQTSGGATCNADADCGYGSCALLVCVCNDRYTGKRCIIVDWNACKETFSSSLEKVEALAKHVSCLAEKVPPVQDFLEDFPLETIIQADTTCPRTTAVAAGAKSAAETIIKSALKLVRDELVGEFSKLMVCAKSSGMRNDASLKQYKSSVALMKRLFEGLIHVVNPDFELEECKERFNSLVETARDFAKKMICDLNLDGAHRHLIQDHNLQDLLEDPSTAPDCSGSETTSDTAEATAKDVIKDAEKFVSMKLTLEYKHLERCLKREADTSDTASTARTLLGTFTSTFTDLKEALIPGPCAASPCQNSGVCTNVRDSYFCKCLDANTGKNCELNKYEEQLDKCKDRFSKILDHGQALAARIICAAKDKDDIKEKLEQASVQDLVDEAPGCTTMEEVPAEEVEMYVQVVLSEALPFVGKELHYAYERLLTCTSVISATGGMSDTSVDGAKEKVEKMQTAFRTLKRLLTGGPCVSNPCKNGGTCTNDPRGVTFICECPDFYDGIQCQISTCPGTLNKCGLCVGGSTGVPDDKGINKCGGCDKDPDAAKPDCNGVCGGTAVQHPICGRCYGGDTGRTVADVFDCGGCVQDGKSQRDCAGNCRRQRPFAFKNKCGVCVGGASAVASNAGMDVCGECGGDGTSCDDCDGVPNGPAKMDLCGVCNGNNNCVKVTMVKPSVVLLGSTEQLTIDGVGLTGANSELVAKSSTTDPGVPLVITERSTKGTITATVPSGLSAGMYTIHYRETATAAWSESDGKLAVLDESNIAITGASPNSFTLQKKGKTEITLSGQGFPAVPLQCIYREQGSRWRAVPASGSGNDRHCMINHPRRGGDIDISLSFDGDNPLGGSVTVRANPPPPVCELVNSKQGDVCLKCDITLSTAHISSAADIFVDITPLGSTLVADIPRRYGKRICFSGVAQTAAGAVLQLKDGVIKARGQHSSPASGSLTVPVMPVPPTPKAGLIGPSVVGSCKDIILRHAYPKKGRNGQPLIYTHTVEPSSGVTIEGADTPKIRLLNIVSELDYKVTQTVCNVAGQCSTDVRVVRKMGHPAPELKIHTTINPKKVDRTSRFSLVVIIKHSSCTARSKLKTQWSTTNTAVKMRRANRNRITFKPGDLPGGESTFFVTVQSETNPEMSATASIKLNVVQSDLRAEIKGGDQRTVGINTASLLLEGEASDPDDPSSLEGDITRTWTCICNGDTSAPCPGMEVPTEVDRVALSPGLFDAGSICEFTYTATKGIGRNMRSTSQSVTVVFVQGEICDVELTTRKKSYSASELVLIVARCKTKEPVTFEWFSDDDDTSFDFVELTEDTADISEATLSDTQDFYISKLQIKKDKLNPGSTYRLVARVIYPNDEEAQSAIELKIKNEIKNCKMAVQDYTAYDLITLDTEDCEGGDVLTYKYYYKTGMGDNSMVFLGKGKELEIYGPTPTSGNEITFVVKVKDVETGEKRRFRKTVQVHPLPIENKSTVRIALEGAVDSKLKAGDSVDAAVLAAKLLKDFGQTVTRRRRRRSIAVDLIKVIMDAAADLMNLRSDGVDSNSVLKVLEALQAVAFVELKTDEKLQYITYMTQLIEMLIEEGDSIPSGLPEMLQVLVTQARENGIVSEDDVRALEEIADKGMKSGLELGDEVIVALSDRDVKTMDVVLGSTAISGKDGICGPIIIPGESLRTRFPNSVVLEMVTYADDVDPHSPAELKDKKTSNVFRIALYDSTTGDKIDVAGLNQEAIICIPITKTIDGRLTEAKYFDTVANSWQSGGISLVTPVPPQCSGCDMVALKTSHFTDFSTFATSDVNECLAGTDTCTAEEYCVNTDGSFNCQCLPGYTGSPCTFDAGINRCTPNPCNGGTCTPGAGQDVTCACTTGRSGNLCQYTLGLFNFDSATYSGGEAAGMVQITIVRTEGHDGSVDVRLNLPVAGDTAQMIADYQNVDAVVKTFINGESSKRFDVSIVDDAFYEGDQTFGITLTATTADARTGVTNSAVVIIVDDDSQVNECLQPVPPTCPTNSRCVDTVSYYKCECLPGFKGSDPCVFDATIDRCDSNPCNGGTCSLNGTQGTACACLNGWNGDFCDQDVDECTDGTATCHASATCSNTAGSYTCACNAGYVGDGFNCVDVDECTAGTAGCDAQATCSNTVGSFTCTCNAGYSGDGSTCSDIDECTAGTAGCHADATCANNPGSFTCTCNAGYSGDGTTSCNDINECTAGTAGCDAQATCANNPGSFTCTCNVGYSGDGSTCTDIDECTAGTAGCDANAACANNVGSFTCTCNAGYSGDGSTCTDIDECTAGTAGCHADATCANNPGSFTCTCNAGYNGDGTTSCSDIDECTAGTAGCDANAACANTVGSFTCTCNAGFTGDGSTCTDIDECTAGTAGCHADATCANNPGSFTCTCNAGYTGDGTTSCNDIDECTAGTAGCDANAACANNVGSFTCTCNAGYSGDGSTCTDIDECTAGTAGCHADATCANSPGSFTCTCNAGYTGDGTASCIDIDECTAGTAGCDANAACSNIPGSFTCTCNAGYSGDGSTCTDIDECTAGTAGCDANAACANNVGSFTCTCNAGYSGDGSTCTDIDECTAGTAGCHADATCANNPGSFTCTCNAGYTGDGTTSCSDIDECTAGTAGCDANAACANNPGSFTCTCNAGYSGDGSTCTDIDECTAGTAGCHADATCANNPGSFTCTCNAGYTGDGTTNCNDINECTAGTAGCDANAACANNPGSFTCTCNAGYSGDGSTCTDIDECSAGTAGCHADATCANNPGSFTCTCNAGYTGDGTTSCNDIDECTAGTAGCDANAACANNVGSFTCTCNAGYSGDGSTCTDVDECTAGTAGCDANAACANNVGSFTCTCNAGYTGDGSTCTDIDECTAGTAGCHADATCANNPGSFTCTCNAGYTGDGTTSCSDIDECTAGTAGCDANAACANNPGSFTCTCNAGYSGDGSACTDIDECTAGTAGCHADATCANNPGSFTCTCNAGYTGDGTTSCSDIDECTAGTAGCDANAACANNPGSFTCTCNAGYSGDGSTCTDIDECTAGTAGCHADATCANNPGSFTCTCNAGYTGDGTTSCNDIDECTAGTAGCDANAACANNVGSFTCTCNAGYSGDGSACTDVDECTAGTAGCDANAACANNVGSFTCTCNAGYSGDGSTCTDIDECTAGTAGCHADATCANNPGSFTCTCNAGYTGDGTTSCSDIDECTAGTAGCDANAACANNPGSFTCTCNAGYSGDGSTCTDIDECTAGTAGCHADATCANNPGSFTCTCNAGYTGDGTTSCNDIDECTAGTAGCDANAACANNAGSFTCTCNAGYSGDGSTCTDVDECTAGTAGCDANAACANNVGSFTCTCNAGYSGDGSTCTDIDECTAGTAGCHADATCANNPGSFTCTCNAGYTGDGTTSCSDIDECTAGTAGCDANAACANNPGSFTCTCNAGYSGDGSTCTDIDECTAGTAGCHADATCANNPGSFTCTCNAGYTGDGTTSCSDIDECTAGTAGCDANAACANNPGSFTCTCNAGYSGDGSTCTDIDECTAGTAGCHADATCANNPGSFTCTCNAGYTGDGTTSCNDIDECTAGTAGCDANAACANNPGSFTCTCNAGYSGDGSTCTDIDECTVGTAGCHADATCANNPGSFTCTCNAGYTGDGTTSCNDIDECTAGTAGCDANAACANNVGSFTCTCNDGYSGDGSTCTDVDECTAGTAGCDGNAACANNVGSFTCTCNAGYSGDGSTCTDIDECTAGTAGCHADATCANNPGSFTCTCNAGYTGDGTTSCSDIDECTAGTAGCDANAACANNPGSFTCTCNAGYSGDGSTCTDIDECTAGTAGCHADATCANNPGSFTCTCNAGYTGDGTTNCNDVDECTAGTAGCDTNAACANNVGSFTCTCNAGYSGDGSTCTDIDECTAGTAGCDANAACANNVGSFTCTCNAGYSGDGSTCTDVDECTAGTAGCDGNAACANNVGSFTCTCNAGYSGDGSTCTDIDECTAGTAGCHADATCANNPGSFTCTCNAGYTGDGTTSCNDIDECTAGTAGCDANAACANNPGSFTCTCNAGYSGDGSTCADIDECTSGTAGCDANAACANNVGSFTCTCNAGYSGDGSTCTDIDECTAGTAGCHADATCANNPGSFTCSCNAGYTGDGTSSCSDINECTAGTAGCDANAACANNPGSFTCTCNAGYSGDGSTCTDIDECSAGTAGCHADATCANNPGSFTCTCNAGYTGDGTTSCNDIDECTAGTAGCDAQATCANNPGSFTCTCNAGYSGDGSTCTDIDECTAGTAGCDANAACANNPGSFTCTCNAGYSGDGSTCTDIDECTAGTAGCHADATCANNPGSFTCTCNAGYSGDGTTSCSDINECTGGTAGCDANAVCANNVGSFTCTCNAGFSGDGSTCTDIDECTAGTAGCHADATCANNPGSFTCICNAGYTGDGTSSCNDINECTAGTAGCDAQATCGNTVGSFTCTCNNGYSGDGSTCTDIDECTAGTAGCHADAACNNNPGSFTCTCNAGFTGDGTSSCVDNDECSLATDNCHDTLANCANTPGSFTCTCVAGYSGDGVTCTDTDECTTGGHNCNAQATCTNNIGSFTCACNLGFTGNGVTCTDNDECALATDNCHDTLANCANTPGSFTCTCIAGYSGDGVTCTDTNECSSSTDNCNAQATCTNTVGSFTCACNAGFTGNGVACTDNDECALATDNCHNTLANCANTPGSFTCSCIAGYAGDGVTCTEIDECTAGTAGCDANAVCTNTPLGSFTCTCDAGFSGNGVSCTDNNECTLNTDNCHANAACTNTPGSFTCACNAGYTGDGVSCTDIDECATNTDNCAADAVATCTNTPGSFTCACRAGFNGNGITCIQCILDCNSVCDGTAAVDCSGVCAGGNTGVTPKVSDACGVCEGDGSSCIAVTAVSPVLVPIGADQTLTVTGTSLASVSVQCVVIKTGETTEHIVPITNRISSTTVHVNIEANTLSVGNYKLLCRVQAGSALGSSTGTFSVYAASAAAALPTCVIDGPSQIDACSDLEVNGVSSRGGETHGLTYTWTVTPNAGLTFNTPVDGHHKWVGLVSGTSYSVELNACTVFGQCKRCQLTVGKSTRYIPTVVIRTSVDITAAPAYAKFELFAHATASTCAGAAANSQLTYAWTLTSSSAVVTNSDTVNGQAYQILPGHVQAGATVRATVTVSLADDSSVSATKYIDIVVASRPLQVIIDGGDIRTSRTNGGAQVFDAVHTKDPDMPTATIFYSWSSVLYDSAGSNIGSCIAAGSQTNGQKLTVNPSTMSANSRCVITLTATSSTGKSGSQTVTLNVEAGNSPVCFLENKLPVLRPDERYILMATCTSSSGIQSTVWTSPVGSGTVVLDLASTTEEQFMDPLPNNEYKMYLVIAKGFLKAGNLYNVEITVTDNNGAVSKNSVTLTVMQGITGGEISCPTSYIELEDMAVTVRKVGGDGGITFALLVQTSTGQFKAVSDKQSTGDFSVTGPQQYLASGNVFNVEVCEEGQNGLCMILSCTVSNVVKPVSITDVSARRKANIARNRREGRPVDAGIALSVLYEKTKDNTLIPTLLEIASEIIQKRTMNENSASTFLDILLSVPPGQLTPAQFTSIVAYMNTASNFFISNNVRVPDRYVYALESWVNQAGVAGFTGSGVQSVSDKVDLLEISGLDYGSTREYDIEEDRLTVFNGVPGNAVKCRDNTNREMFFNFGDSVREIAGHRNIKFKVRAFKNRPAFITDSVTVVIVPIVEVVFYNPDTDAVVVITNLQTPASFDLNVNQDQLNQLRIGRCVYWDTTNKNWVNSGVTTGVQTGSKVQCKSSHFTSFAVVNDNSGYNAQNNIGWIVGTVIGVVIAMILIIALIVFLVYRYKKNTVIDISRPTTRESEKRPGSGDGLMRNISLS